MTFLNVYQRLFLFVLHRHVSTIRYSLSSLVGRFPKTLYIYIYIWKLNQTVLELDLIRAVNLCSALAGIWTHNIDTLQNHSLSLTSSALDHSTTSTPYIYYMLFSYQTGYIMWHSRLRIYIPWGTAEGNIHHKPGMSHYIPFPIAE